MPSLKIDKSPKVKWMKNLNVGFWLWWIFNYASGSCPKCILFVQVVSFVSLTEDLPLTWATIYWILFGII